MTVSFHFIPSAIHEMTLLLKYSPAHSRNLVSRTSLRLSTMANLRRTMVTFQTATLKRTGISRVLLRQPANHHLAEKGPPMVNTRNTFRWEKLSISKMWLLSRVFIKDLFSHFLNGCQLPSFLALSVHQFDRIRAIWI